MRFLEPMINTMGQYISDRVVDVPVDSKTNE